MDKLQIKRALNNQDKMLCYKRLIRNLRVRKNEKSSIKIVNHNIAADEKGKNSRF